MQQVKLINWQQLYLTSQSANYYNSKSTMTKLNPNRQQLIEFINTLQKDLPLINKIEDLSSGVHYMFLLHKIHPNIVRLGKVNLKAFHEHQNITNLKILSAYLAEVRAPFTFQIAKVAIKNYQENLNLLKNLFHYYNSPQNDRTSISKEPKDQKSKIGLKKPQQKVVIKLPEKLSKTVQMKKLSPQKSGFTGMMDDSKQLAEQIKKILVVVKEQTNPVDEVAEEKLRKIKKILGIEDPYSQQKKKKENQKMSFSNVCSASKTNMKNNSDFSTHKSQLQTKTQERLSKNNAVREGRTEANKGKVFDCEDVRKSAFKKYNISSSNRKSFGSRFFSGGNQDLLNVNNEDDASYNQNLLSPYSGRKMSSRRKSRNHTRQEKKSQPFQENKPDSNQQKTHQQLERILRGTEKAPVLKKTPNKKEEILLLKENQSIRKFSV